MQSTMELLSKALDVKRASRWCEQMDLDISTLAQAKKRGRLSPTLAGNFAIELGESPEHWIAIAAIEAEKESPLLERLRKSQAHWRKRSLCAKKWILPERRRQWPVNTINRSLDH